MSRPADTDRANAAVLSAAPEAEPSPDTGPRDRGGGPLSVLPSPAARLWTMTSNSIREQWRAVLIWGVSLGLANILYVALFPGFKDSLNSYLSTMPAIYLQFLGLEAGAEITVQTFLNMEMFAIIAPLAVPFFAILLGARTVAGAEDRLQLDVLLSNPVPRWHLIVARFFTMIVGLFVMLAVMSVLTYVGGLVAGVDLPALDLAWAGLNLLPFSLFFGGLALLLSALLRRTSLVIALPAGILVAMYVGNGLANSVASFKQAKYFSLFYYYGAAILDGIDWVISSASWHVLSMALAVLAVLALSAGTSTSSSRVRG